MTCTPSSGIGYDRFWPPAAQQASTYPTVVPLAQTAQHHPSALLLLPTPSQAFRALPTQPMTRAPPRHESGVAWNRLDSQHTHAYPEAVPWRSKRPSSPSALYEHPKRRHGF